MGTNVSGTFHAVTYTFQRYNGCGASPGPIEYAMNGTIVEFGGSPLYFHFEVIPPLVREWNNYTSPDGTVLVAWLGLSLNVTLVFAT
ncbi:MAG: hypothetical protein WA688_03855 [Thermoplasmata archaeon]